MEAFREIYPRAFHSRFLEQGVRPDGRTLRQLRPSSRSASCLRNAMGSALVKLGRTTVVCGVTGMVGPWAQEEPLVNVKVELTPLSSPDVRPGQVVPQALVYQGKINALLRGGGGGGTTKDVVPSAQLVVDRGEKPVYWHLQVDVCCVEDDGAVFDACLMACICALKDTRLPPLRLDAATQRFVVAQSGNATPLQLVTPPLALSFALIDTYVVADPSHEEETLANATVHVVWDSAGQLRAIDKPGGSPMARSELTRCAEQAKERAKEFFSTGW